MQIGDARDNITLLRQYGAEETKKCGTSNQSTPVCSLEIRVKQHWMTYKIDYHSLILNRCFLYLTHVYMYMLDYTSIVYLMWRWKSSELTPILHWSFKFVMKEWNTGVHFLIFQCHAINKEVRSAERGQVTWSDWRSDISKNRITDLDSHW